MSRTYYARLQVFDKAIEHLKKVVDLGEAQLMTYSNLGYCYTALRKHQESRAAFMMALEISPNNTAALNNLGIEWLNADNPEKAEQLFRRVLEIDPKYAVAYRNLGFIYLKKRMLDQARKYYETGLQIDPFLKLGADENAFLHRQ